MKTMIRYSRDMMGNPRNTLYTVEKDGIIYFGIAKCNKKDKMNKKKGVMIARGRAEVAEETLSEDVEAVEGFVVDDNGLMGFCCQEHIFQLLCHFELINKRNWFGDLITKNSLTCLWDPETEHEFVTSSC